MTAVIASATGRSARRGRPGDSRPTAEDLLRRRANLPADDPERSRLRAQVIAANLMMAHRLARRCAGRGELIAGLKRVAANALAQSIDCYDPQHQDSFNGHAVPRVLAALNKHLGDTTWGMRVARSIQDLICEAGEAGTELAYTRRRSQTAAEDAFHLGPGVDIQPSIPPNAGADDYRELVPLLDSLAPRARRLVAMRYYAMMSQNRIAAEIGVPPRQLSRLQKQSLDQLRAAITHRSSARP